MRNRHREKGPRDPDFRAIAKEIVDVNDLDPRLVAVIYGPPGTGKTTLLGTFPKPLLVIDIGEEGTDSVRGGKGVKVIRISNWDKLDSVYWFLKKGDHQFKSVGIDTITGAQDLSILKLFKKRGLEPEQGKVGGWGTMRKQDWGDVSADLKSLIYNFRELSKSHDLKVAFLAHDKKEKGSEEEDDDDDAGIKPVIVPRLMPSVVSTLNASVNLIGHTFVREKTKVIKIGGKKKETRRVEYCLRLGPHSYYTTKVRKPKETEAPAFIVDPDYEQLVELVEGDDE